MVQESAIQSYISAKQPWTSQWECQLRGQHESKGGTSLQLEVRPASRTMAVIVDRIFPVIRVILET